MAPLAARATRCWLRVRISTRFVADGRVLTERFTRRRVGASVDYTYGRRSPPWGCHLAHLPLHAVLGENLVWVSWTDDDGAWAPQSPWRCHLLDHHHLFLDGFLFCALFCCSWSTRGEIGGVELLLVIGCRWCPFPRTFSACSMVLPELPFGVRRSIRLVSGYRWSLMDRFDIVLVGGLVSRRPF
jgi:hypothetical protein